MTIPYNSDKNDDYNDDDYYNDDYNIKWLLSPTVSSPAFLPMSVRGSDIAQPPAWNSRRSWPRWWGLEMRKTRTRVCITQVLFSSTRWRRRILFKYSARTRLIFGWYSSTRGAQTSTWYTKTNRVHISNGDCDDIGNGVLVSDVYYGEKGGVLLWDCLFCLRKSVITIPESGPLFPLLVYATSHVGISKKQGSLLISKLEFFIKADFRGLGFL